MFVRRLITIAAVLAVPLSAIAPAPLPAAPRAPDLCRTPKSEWPGRLARPPLLCGKTTFYAPNGIAGFKVRIPQVSPPVAIPEEGVRITMTKGTYAFFGLNAARCHIPELDMCMDVHAYRIPEWRDGDSVVVRDPPTLRPGLYEIYIVSDGKVTIELDVENRPGRMSITPTGKIDAALQSLPRNCPMEPCDNVGFGGAMNVNGKKGWVSSVAYTLVPGHIPGTPAANWANSTGLVACVYPSAVYPAASPDPDDHPQGCDLVPGPDDPNSGVNFFGSAADFGASGYAHYFGTAIAHGPIYAGYAATNYSPVVPGGSYGAWGMWITKGVKCPSGNLLSCG